MFRLSGFIPASKGPIHKAKNQARNRAIDRHLPEVSPPQGVRRLQSYTNENLAERARTKRKECALGMNQDQKQSEQPSCQRPDQ